MTANQLESLLCKPVWDYKDIMTYCDVSPTTAYDIIQQLRGLDPAHKKEGWVSNFPKMVKRDAVLHYYETDLNKEMAAATVAKIISGTMRIISNIALGGEVNG